MSYEKEEMEKMIEAVMQGLRNHGFSPNRLFDGNYPEGFLGGTLVLGARNPKTMITGSEAGYHILWKKLWLTTRHFFMNTSIMPEEKNECALKCGRQTE